MEKEMLVFAKLKEGMFEKFMGFMQSPEGLAERAEVLRGLRVSEVKSQCTG